MINGSAPEPLGEGARLLDLTMAENKWALGLALTMATLTMAENKWALGLALIKTTIVKDTLFIKPSFLYINKSDSCMIISNSC